MNKNKIRNLLLNTEDNAWVRAIDGTIVVSAILAIVLVFMLLSLSFENRLLGASFCGAIVSMPIVAYMMYRQTNLTKIERMSVLILTWSTAVSFMVASFEYTKNI